MKSERRLHLPVSQASKILQRDHVALIAAPEHFAEHEDMWEEHYNSHLDGDMRLQTYLLRATTSPP